MIEGLIITKEDIIELEAGNVIHAIKDTSPGFYNFGEAYFSKINNERIKGWKRHSKMILNLLVPVGKVTFVVCKLKNGSIYDFEKFELSSENNYRLTIPAGIWFAFKGMHSPYSLILNVASIPHDSDEVENCNLDQINFDWENIK